MNLSTSIIIAAHNETLQLQQNLPFIFAQQNIDFEVIIVNDRSSDNTKEVLNSFQNNKLIVLEITELPNGITGKKNALTEGIKIAQYENLLFTDADCKPNSDVWAYEMVSKLEQNDVVLGISQYENKGSFLSEFIQFETLFTALQYIGFAKMGFPYMGVGRNIAYKKSLFIKNNGFKTHQHLLGGDDDLFVGEVAPNAKIGTSTHYKTQTVSVPKTTWKDYLQQKRRHLAVGLHYKWRNQWKIGLYQQLRFWFYLICISSFFILPFNKNFALFLLTFVAVLEWLVFWYLKKTWNFKLKVYLWLIYNSVYLLFFLITSVSIALVKVRKW